MGSLLEAHAVYNLIGVCCIQIWGCGGETSWLGLDRHYVTFVKEATATNRSGIAYALPTLVLPVSISF